MFRLVALSDDPDILAGLPHLAEQLQRRLACDGDRGDGAGEQHVARQGEDRNDIGAVGIRFEEELIGVGGVRHRHDINLGMAKLIIVGHHITKKFINIFVLHKD